MKPEDINLPRADEYKAYTYVMLMSSGNIKIGITTNPSQRIQSLSESNGGGFRILDAYFTPQHYIADTLEKRMHWVFHEYRLEGEFFNGCDYHQVIQYLRDVLDTDDFKTAELARKQFVMDMGRNLTDYRGKQNDRVQEDKCKSQKSKNHLLWLQNL